MVFGIKMTEVWDAGLSSEEPIFVIPNAILVLFKPSSQSGHFEPSLQLSPLQCTSHLPMQNAVLNHTQYASGTSYKMNLPIT